MRNMIFKEPIFANVAKPPRKSTTRLYFGDLVMFLKEIKREKKYQKRHKKKIKI